MRRLAWTAVVTVLAWLSLGAVGLVGAATSEVDGEITELVNEMGGLNLFCPACPEGANCCTRDCILSCCTITCPAGTVPDCQCSLGTAECACHPVDICAHDAPHAHTYGTGGGAGGRSDSVAAGEDLLAQVVSVMDSNPNDCDRDGVPRDFDGDYDAGIGGGFFGYGPWADEPTCGLGLVLHGGTVRVNDVVFGDDVWFVIGADDTSGPDANCMTDGRISPGDPAVDPTADADDCLTGPLHGSGSTCGAGGDGGYWVLLSGALFAESAGNVSPRNPPTTGTLTA